MSENLARQFLIREDVVFLNHGSFGACPRPVFEKYQQWQLELERQPVEFLGRNLVERMVNGQPGLVIEFEGAVETVIAFDVDGDHITNIWAIRNPEKLQPWKS